MRVPFIVNRISTPRSITLTLRKTDKKRLTLVYIQRNLSLIGYDIIVIKLVIQVQSNTVCGSHPSILV